MQRNKLKVFLNSHSMPVQPPLRLPPPPNSQPACYVGRQYALALGCVCSLHAGHALIHIDGGVQGIDGQGEAWEQQAAGGLCEWGAAGVWAKDVEAWLPQFLMYRQKAACRGAAVSP